jgi:hypothetical protein
MPRINVIVLDKVGPTSYRYAMWADVPTARQSFYASTSISKSAWNGASSQDIANLQSGAVVEKVDVYQVSTTDTVASVEAILAATALSFQNGVASNNPWAFYGSFQSSSGVWTTTGVA